MKYFVKVSWENHSQPLCRVHENGFVDIAPSEFEYGMVELVKDQLLGRWATAGDFTIDFMMPVPEETA